MVSNYDLLHRFLRRDNNRGYWEEVGDDTAREKASQVLRDAVATLDDSSVAPPSPPTTVSAVLEVPEATSDSLKRPADEVRKPPSVATTPTLEPVVSSAPPTPSPSGLSSQRGRKRRRYTTPRHIPTVPYHPHHHHHYLQSHPATALIRRHSDIPAHHSDILYQQVRDDNRSVARAGSGRRVPHAEHHPAAGINEFDLFHGDLLDSDPEDNGDPFPPVSESHSDFF